MHTHVQCHTLHSAHITYRTGIPEVAWRMFHQTLFVCTASVLGIPNEDLSDQVCIQYSVVFPFFLSSFIYVFIFWGEASCENSEISVVKP